VADGRPLTAADVALRFNDSIKNHMTSFTKHTAI